MGDPDRRGAGAARAGRLLLAAWDRDAQRQRAAAREVSGDTGTVGGYGVRDDEGER